MPKELKSAMIRPLLKKPNANTETFSNFCPVSNLQFLLTYGESSVLTTQRLLDVQWFT